MSNHPGLVFALLQSTSNPVVLLMKQDEIQVHELKVFSSKAKVRKVSINLACLAHVHMCMFSQVQGMVALRQLSAGEKVSSLSMLVNLKVRCVQVNLLDILNIYIYQRF